MCGFVGIVMLDGGRPDRTALERMTRAIRHRGQDESASHASGPVGFGFQRLSILDLTPNGHQPMTAADGRVVMVFNGEIYNYRELRRELELRGHAFRSAGDTEVLLHAYSEWGRDCLAKLNGMFAFLIYDARRGVLFGARDRFGEKPLFYHHAGDRVLFASEIKAIRASGLYATAFNWPRVGEFFLRGDVDIPRPSHDTLYEGICQPPPAHAFELHLDGTWRCWRYWSLDGVQQEPVADPAEKCAELFDDSIRLRLRSDVPVGVCLSGGLDSTSIICSMSRQMDGVGTGDQTLRAFCFHAEGFDETRYIAETIRQTGGEHTMLDVGPAELWKSLDRFFWHQEEPVCSITAVVGYKLMELAASHGVKVVLNGQGADETLAGYPGYARDYWHSLLGCFRFRDVWREIGAQSGVGRGARGRLLLGALGQFARAQLGAFPWYRALSARREQARAARDPWYTPELSRHLAPPDMRNYAGPIHHMLRVSMARFPLPFYLRVEDRNAMAHSVETRLPFLDHRLVEFAFRLGPDWFFRGPCGKILLREAMRGRIPESVRTRVDKMGFPTPMSAWFRGPLHARILDIVNSREFRERGIYDVAAVARDLERHRRGEIDVANKLWDIVQWEAIARVAASDPAVTPSAAPVGSA